MTSDSRDYYEILGVSKDASFEEIRATFRSLVRQYDSRRNLNQGDARRLAEIDDAYDTLGNGPFRAAYDRAHATFHESHEVLNSARSTALYALGEIAFDLATSTGAGITDEWAFLNIGVAKPPDGLWQATFESILEEVLKPQSTQSAESAALSAAWVLALDGTERAARRQALGARSPTYFDALCFDFALSIVAMAANVLGFRFGLLDLSDRPNKSAWPAAFDAAYEIAFNEFPRSYPSLLQTGSPDQNAYEALYPEAAEKAFQATKPFVSEESFLKVLSSNGVRPERGAGKGCGTQIIVLAAALVIVSLTILAFGLA